MKLLYPKSPTRMQWVVEFEEAMNNSASIIEVVKHPSFPQIANLCFGGFHPVDVDSSGCEVKVDYDTICYYTSKEAQEHAIYVQQRAVNLVSMYPQRYAAGDHGRVQIYVLDQWVTVKGLTKKNYTITEVFS